MIYNDYEVSRQVPAGEPADAEYYYNQVLEFLTSQFLRMSIFTCNIWEFGKVKAYASMNRKSWDEILRSQV